MALANERALNIYCKIGNMDISHKCIDTFEVDRNFSDLNNKFSMTIIDSPDTGASDSNGLLWDLEMYMNGGHRNITIKYGDLESNKFTHMGGTIWNYQSNFVGNIKTLTISGLVSTYLNSNIVGNLTYNIDWNHYVNKRTNEKNPWNITSVQYWKNKIAGQEYLRNLSLKNVAMTEEAKEKAVIQASEISNSYILNEEFKEALTANSEFLTITSPLNSSASIQLPIPDLFVAINSVPIEDIMKCNTNQDGKFVGDYNIDNYKDSKNPYHQYYIACTSSTDFWGRLTPYNSTFANSDVPYFLPLDKYAQKTVSIKYGADKKWAVVGYKDFQYYTDYANSIDYNVDKTDSYIKFGEYTEGFTPSGAIQTFGGSTWGLCDVLYEAIYGMNPTATTKPSKKDFEETLANYIQNTLYRDKIKLKKIQGQYFWVKGKDIVSMPVSKSSTSSESTLTLMKHTQGFSINHMQGSIFLPSGYIVSTQFDNHTNLKATKINERAIEYLNQKTKTKVTTKEVTKKVDSHENRELTGTYWKDNSGNIRGFLHSDGVLYIQARPGTKSYRNASMLSLQDSAVNITEIVEKLAVLEGWNTANNKYLAQTATLQYSDSFVMNNETAIDFITKKCIPNSITPAGVYTNKDGTQVGVAEAYDGFNLFFDNDNILHYHPISNANLVTTNITMGYNYPDSPVISFSVNTKGTAFYTQASKEITAVSVTTGEEISSISGLTSTDSYSVVKSKIHNAYLDSWFGSSYTEVESKDYTNANDVQKYLTTTTGKLVTTMVKSSTTSSATVQSEMNAALEKIRDFTVTGTLSMVGDYRLKPSHYISITNMIKGAGYKEYNGDVTYTNPVYSSSEPVVHPSSGKYLIMSQKDTISQSEGFFQELNLIKYTKALKDLFTNDIDYGISATWWEEYKEQSGALVCAPYSNVTSTKKKKNSTKASGSSTKTKTKNKTTNSSTPKVSYYSNNNMCVVNKNSSKVTTNNNNTKYKETTSRFNSLPKIMP